MLGKNLITAASGNAAAGEYQISRSLRFNSADSAYLNRTPASASNRKTWTISFWVKLGDLTKSGTSGWNTIFGAYTDNNNRLFAYTRDSTNGNVFQIFNNASGSTNLQLISNQVFRDTSSWYHFVVALDTTQATSSDRCKVYVNGSQITSWATATYPSQNADLSFNNNNTHLIGANYFSGLNLYHDGYLTETHFIDGQALTPSSFGEVNATTGVWSPIAYAGTYGTNGFYLDFSDNTSTTTLGYDAAGSNDWTLNNFSVTAGAGNDSLVDTPTPYGTDTGAGGEVRGNYATLNPLAKSTDANFIVQNGNLEVNTLATNGTIGTAPSTIAVSSGKWYYEVQVLNSNVGFSGIAPADTNFGTNLRAGRTTLGHMYRFDGQIYRANNNTVTDTYGPVVVVNDVIGCALDVDNNTIEWYVNGTGYGTKTIESDTTWVAAVGDDDGADGKALLAVNFGQRPFAYTAPSGFKALVTTNLPDPTVVQGDDYFNTLLYTGDGTDPRSLTGVGFQPDFVWLKIRGGSSSHILYNSVVGVGPNTALHSDSTNAEGGIYMDNATYGYLSSFDSDGFTVVPGSSPTYTNTSGTNYVAWNWNAGGSNATNTDGTITSTVRANTTAGFSIVSYTGTGTTSSVGHGLGTTPAMIICKSRTSAVGWPTWHQALGGTDKVITLNTTGAVQTISGYWGSAINSTVFGLISGAYDNNRSGDSYIAYCFAEIPGFSAFGSYTGNGSTDGPFIYTGFRPAFVMFKNTSATSDWIIRDTSRDPYNTTVHHLKPNSSAAEVITASTFVDFLSNGFKMRNSDVAFNTSGNTFIYMAFAENPFKNALAR